MISHRYKFIFIHIPKTGGTSIESALLDKSCELLSNQWDSKVHHTPLNHLTLQEMVDYEFIDQAIIDSYFKFCFVRNPWDRAVSEVAYLGSYFEGADLKQKLLNMLNCHSYGNHIRPQIDFIDTNHQVTIDFIGRFETLQQDLNQIFRLLGLPRRKLSHHLRSQHAPYWTYYDDFLKEQIAEKYKEDIKRFDYYFEQK